MLCRNVLTCNVSSQGRVKLDSAMLNNVKTECVKLGRVELDGDTPDRVMRAVLHWNVLSCLESSWNVTRNVLSWAKLSWTVLWKMV